MSLTNTQTGIKKQKLLPNYCLWLSMGSSSYLKKMLDRVWLSKQCKTYHFHCAGNSSFENSTFSLNYQEPYVPIPCSDMCALPNKSSTLGHKKTHANSFRLSESVPLANLRDKFWIKMAVTHTCPIHLRDSLKYIFIV